MTAYDALHPTMTEPPEATDYVYRSLQHHDRLEDDGLSKSELVAGWVAHQYGDTFEPDGGRAEADITAALDYLLKETEIDRQVTGETERYVLEGAPKEDYTELVGEEVPEKAIHLEQTRAQLAEHAEINSDSETVPAPDVPGESIHDEWTAPLRRDGTWEMEYEEREE